MKKTFLFVLSLSFLLSVSFAATSTESNFFDRGEELEIPEELEVLSGGFPEAPVVSCPRPSEKYANLLNQLTDIKNKIKEEACPESEVVVSDLESLVGSERKKFLEIIKQGAFGEGQLNKEQVAEVEKYVQSIVEKAASVTGLLENKACFRDGKNDSALAYVSSVISEVSGAVGALAGPFGAKFALGGKIAGALVGSVNKIVTARETYKYTYWDKTLKRQVVNMEDINNYFNNLCTYHDFKGDLDVESHLVDPRNRYDEVFAITEEYLHNIGTVCVSCADFISQYEEIEKRGSIDLTNPERIERERRGTDQVDPARIPPGDEQVALAIQDISEVSAKDLLKFANSVSAEAIVEQKRQEEERRKARELMAEDIGLETPVVSTEPIVVIEEAMDPYDWAQYRLPPTLTKGPIHWDPSWELSDMEATIRALLIRSWIRKEATNLELTIREGNGRPGRSGVRDEQQRIEEFLIDKEAIAFIDKLVEKFEGKNGLFTGYQGSFAGLVGAAKKASYEIESASRIPELEALLPDPSFNVHESMSYGLSSDVAHIAHAYHELFRPDLDFDSIIDDGLQVAFGGSSSERVEDVANRFIDARENAKEKLEEAWNIVVDDYFMIRDRCMFFQRSHFANNRKLRQSCVTAGRKIQKMYDVATALEETGYRYRGGFILEVLISEHDERYRPNYVRDFLGSVEYVMSKDLKDLQSNIELLEQEKQEIIEYWDSKTEISEEHPWFDEEVVTPTDD